MPYFPTYVFQVWLDGVLGKIVFHCTAIVPRTHNLNFNLMFSQALVCVSMVK
ncbi:MAG: hypothetical protein HW387_500 [Parachlamydiales bacterium]|nr:hypothetical protein [Parachlamydiales bacterium]